MDDIFAGRLMTSPVLTVTPDATVQDAATRMLDNGCGSVVIVDSDNELEGILTSTDFVRLASEDRSATDTTVADVMATDVVTTGAQTPIRDVGDLMLEHGFHHVPVTDDTEGVIGMITTTDLTAYLSHLETPSPR